MKNMRKMVSVICVVALLLSLCAVSFVGGSSAVITEEDGATIINTWQTDSVALDLTFEGTDCGGIAMATSSTKKVENGYFTLANGNNAYGAAWLGIDATINSGAAIPTSTSYTTANTPKANLFTLEPNTTYKITFKYAFKKSTPTSTKLELMCAVDPYLASGHGRGTTLASMVATTYDAWEAKAGTQVADSTEYEEWKEETYIFTTKSSLTNKYPGFRAGSSTGANFKVDSIKIEIGSVDVDYIFNDIDNEYFFDYTDTDAQARVLDRMATLSANSNTASGHYSWYNWGEYLASRTNFVTAESYPGVPGFAEEGMKYTIGKGADLSEQNTFSANVWASNALIYDPDVGTSDGWGNSGGYFMLKDEASYLITVKYKTTQISGTRLQLAIGALTNPISGAVSVIPGSLVTITQVCDEWQTLSVALDTSEYTSYADKILTLTGSTNADAKWGTIIVESITVKEKRDSQNGIAVMKYVNRGEPEFALETANNSLMLPIPENINPNSGFGGWYTSADFAEGTMVDMSNFVPQEGLNTLYARWINKV